VSVRYLGRKIHAHLGTPNVHLDLCLCVKANPDAYKIKWDLLPYVEVNQAAPAEQKRTDSKR
jgi:hypothetical protein